MGSIQLGVVVLTVALLAAASWTVLRKAFGVPVALSATGEDLELEDARAARLMYRAVARAAGTALVAGCGASILLAVLAAVWPQSYGLPSALAPGVGALTGLLAFTLTPRPSGSLRPRRVATADLVPRSATSFARQWVFILPLVAASALLAGLLFTGLYSATDENGLHRVFQRRSLSGWGVESGQIVDVQYNLSSSGPFPGWYYGLPVMVCTVLLIAAVYGCLRRVATAPGPATPGLFATDTNLRTTQTRFIMTSSSAALGFQLAGLSAVTGTVLRTAHLDAVPTVNLNAAVGSTPVEPGSTLALVLIFSSLVFTVVASVLLGKAAATVLGLLAAGRTPRVRPQARPVR
ncbi:hypothetical protein ACX80W_04075 [Arthrobacter sp. TMN-37]